MSNPINIFVLNTKMRAHQEAQNLIDEGFDVVVTGPTDDLFTTKFKDNENGQDVEGLQSPYVKNWVVIGFNKTEEDVIEIE